MESLRAFCDLHPALVVGWGAIGIWLSLYLTREHRKEVGR